jgi:hypothetical protein
LNGRLAPGPRLRHNGWMAPSSRAETLLEKIHDLPADKLVEVENFVDFLRQKPQRNVSSPEERLRHAADTGRLTPPAAGHQRSSISTVRPVAVPGRPASELVVEDRR